MSIPSRFPLAALTLTAALGLFAAESQLVEAEDFQFTGGWQRVPEAGASAKNYLYAPQVSGSQPASPDAVTLVTLDKPGDYTFWARARDFAADRPGTRRFALLVDGERLEQEGGTHGRDGFAWQALGKRTLAAGEHLLRLRDTTRGFGRCDALYVTRTAASPASLTPAQLSRVRVKPTPLAADAPAAFRPARLTSASAAPAATLESPTMRVGFYAERGEDGQPWIVRRASVKVGEAWRPLPDAAGGEALFVLRAEAVSADLLRTATWSGARVPVEVVFGGQRVTTCGPATDPFTAAPAARFAPREVVAQADADAVVLNYRSADGQSVPVRWSLDPDDPHTLRAQARLTAPSAGFYSLGFCAIEETARDRVQFVQLPPLYQFQRLPPSPDLLCNTLTPHPLALAQIPWGATNAPLCVAVSAEPEDLPFVWADATNAVCGLGLLNSRSLVQPSFFSPVLGSPRSRLAAGEARDIRWRVVTRPGEWKAALEAYCANVMKVADYREPINASLTEAALNMVDLMMSAEHGGWSDELKGFYDIESATMGKHAAPLALLSAAALTRSEAFWAARGLPSVEFMLSRRGSAILQSGVTREGAPAKGQLRVPGEFYSTTGWEGLERLTAGLNPWMTQFALPGGKVRSSTDYNTSWPWTERLAARRLAPALVSLDDITENADAWLAKEVYGRQAAPVAFQLFYNIHFYPYWWDLIDLYEASSDRRYLDAAEECAFHTLAGLWSHPRVPEGEVTVHPGGSQVTYHPLWHKNNERFRLGWPRQTNDTPERAVPAWQVSPVGLGLEQPSTYTSFRGAMNNIMQSTWAPHLLRLYRHTDRAVYRTFARNGVIGRFANYPGYYLTCFTDRPQDPRYPYIGPDITSLYYHHIPVHFAFTVDYLVADAEARSGGQISFPWVKQKNYAWFNNRVYTAEPGNVYGDKWASLWIERGIVATDAKTDWLAARSPERFWVMLMNQTRAPRAVTARLDRARIGLTGEEGVLYAGDADPFVAYPPAEMRPAPTLSNDTVTVTIPALSMVTLGYPAAHRREFPEAQPLAGSHRTAAAGAFGEAHAFAIRSPWGKDAVYAVLTADAIPGAKAVFACEGVEKAVERFPYEASFYPVRDPAAPVRVTLSLPGAAPQTVELR